MGFSKRLVNSLFFVMLSTKEMIDLYQRTKGVDLWKSQYEAMQQTLRQLKAKNFELRTQIRQRLGYDLNDLSFHELSDLENIALANGASNLYAFRHHHNGGGSLITTSHSALHSGTGGGGSGGAYESFDLRDLRLA
uniref:K-box domain-containing protein n=1 Tax=Cannabis sativa TaxID=3483 RepID=A0A803PFJ4_CANSA